MSRDEGIFVPFDVPPGRTQDDTGDLVDALTLLHELWVINPEAFSRVSGVLADLVSVLTAARAEA